MIPAQTKMISHLQTIHKMWTFFHIVLFEKLFCRTFIIQLRIIFMSFWYTEDFLNVYCNIYLF